MLAKQHLNLHVVYRQKVLDVYHTHAHSPYMIHASIYYRLNYSFLFVIKITINITPEI